MPQVSSPASGSPINSVWADEVADAINALPGPIGMVMWGFFTADPPDYLLLDGRELTRSGIYAPLYAAIGAYGGAGNGTTTWTLPDMRNRFPMVPGPTPAVGLGGTGGSANAVVAAHAHTINEHTHTFTSGNDSVNHTHGLGGHTHSTPHNHVFNHFHLASFPRVVHTGPTSHTHSYGGNTVAEGVTGGVAYGTPLSIDVEGNALNAPGGTNVTAGASAGSGGPSGGSDGVSVWHQHSGTTAGASNRGTDTVGVAAANANLPPYMGLQAAVKYR